jgi:hypothetical protein
MRVATVAAIATLILFATSIESQAHSGNIKSVGDALFTLSIVIVGVFVFWLIDNWNKH